MRRVVVGAVKGDLHDIGKNPVCMMLEGAGLKVADLGTDVEPTTFPKAVVDTEAPPLCLSALLASTKPIMRSTSSGSSSRSYRTW